MNEVVFRRGAFIVVKSISPNGPYFTIVNTILGKHSHAYNNELTAAIMICKSAYKNEIPKHYSKWMKNSIRRLIGDDN